MSFSASTLFAFLEAQVGRDALAAAMVSYLSPSSSTPVQASSTAPVQSTPAPSKGRAKKVKDPGAPKKAPNDWIKFTSRVRSVVTAAATDGKKPLPAAVTQTSSALKAAGLMPSATDGQILAAYADWVANPPAISKWAAEHPTAVKSKKTKSDSSSTTSSSSATTNVAKTLDFSEPAPAPKKARKPMSDEAKAAAKAKRDAKKAAKSATTLPPLPAPVVDVMDFEPFTWRKLSLLKNSRGDVLTEDMEWFGSYDAATGKMDTAAAQPSDLEL